jgi:ribonuclease HI
MAILKGLHLAVNMGIEDLVCFSDSQLSVNLIAGEVYEYEYHAYAVLIQDIKDLIASHNYNILHTLRLCLVKITDS